MLVVESFIMLVKEYAAQKNDAQRLRLYAVRDCGLLTCPPTRNFMRGRTLELPLKPLLHIAFVSGRFYHQWLFIKLLNSDFPIGLSNKEPCPPPVISINWLFWQFEQLSTSCLKVGQVYS